MNESSPQIIDTGDGFTIKWRGRFLASPYSPRKRACSTALKENLSAQTLYLLPNPLFGYGITELLSKIPGDSFLLAMEEDSAVRTICGPYLNEIQKSNHSFEFLDTINPLQVFSKLKKIGLWKFRKCKVLYLNGPGKEKLQISRLHQFIQQQINLYWKNRITLIELGNRWILNTLRNLQELSRSKALPRVQKPLLLCGAAASTDNIWEDLALYRDRFYILTVDTALPAFTQRGLQPDAIINVDGQFYNFMDFYHSGNEILTISDLTCYPASVRNRPVSFFYTQFTDSPFVEELALCLSIPPVKPMGSVGVTAMHIATLLTDGPIILAGLDFAYTPGASHVKGSIFQQHYFRNQSRLSPDGGLYVMNMKKGSHRLSPASDRYSDPMLISYYHNLLDYLKSVKQNLYQWKLEGLPLNLPEFQLQLLETQLVNEPDDPETAPPVLPKEWMEDLKNQLENLLATWNRFAEDSGYQTELVEALSKLDILYFDSPFNPPEPDESIEKIIGLIKKARKILALLERA